MEIQEIEAAFETYWDKLYRVALIMLKNKYDAEDAVQDTFVKYMMKAPVFTEREHEKAWVLKVCMNICKNKLRFHNLHPTISFDSVEISGEKQEDEVLIACLMKLPDKYKETILLYYIEGYKCMEIGKVLKVTESTVKKRLERGRNLLKKELGEA